MNTSTSVVNDIAKLHEKLARSVVPGVYAMVPKEDIVVPAASWREYHRKIQEFCASSNVEEIASQLDEGRKCRDIRMTLMRRLERLDTAGQRNATYDNVYNAMVKSYRIFSVDTTLNLTNTSLYGIGFQSPRANFPDCDIRLCAFHVIQTWTRNLKSKVRLDGSYTAAELATVMFNNQKRRDKLMSDTTATYRQDILQKLKHILTTCCIDDLYRSIVEFMEKYGNQNEFLGYLESQWCGCEDQVQKWAYTYIESHMQRMMTNNYMESWHNQLKTVYMKRTRNKRLDKLIFILTHEVEFYFEMEYIRISQNAGRTGPLKNEQARRAYYASTIAPEDIPNKVTGPREAAGAGIWQVQSFRFPKLVLIAQTFATLYHERDNVLRMNTVSAEDATEYARKGRLREALHHLETVEGFKNDWSKRRDDPANLVIFEKPKEHSFATEI
ncbi:hypothetical protein VTP01DRAFT_3513 [Rhizomucor pusillus]|uniref:uncharacterized protein n=1 Tax=Rhizomucor pusillus TaxID=4840 RepID=UPI003743E37D